MTIGKEEYFFYEWLILAKQMNEEKFNKLTEEEFQNLKLEFIKLYMRTIP